MYKIKINKYYICIFLALALEHNFFYLFPQTHNIIGLDIGDVSTIFQLVLFFVVFSVSDFKLTKGKYSYFVLGGLALVLTSAVAGFITYGQSILTGIIVQRTRISSLLFYFVLIRWFKRNKIDKDGLIECLGSFFIVYLVICISQYFLGALGITFTYTGAEGLTRYGSARYWFSGIFLVLYSGELVDGIYNSKKSRLRSIILILLVFFFFFSITKTRMAAMGYLAAVSICLILHKGSTWIKTSIAILGILVFYILLSSQLGTDVINTITGGNSVSGDTVTARFIGQAYYSGLVFENPIRAIFGCGYASSKSYTALQMAFPHVFSSAYGYAIALYPQDNGVFGMLYYYGLAGIAWWFVGLKRSYSDALFVTKKDNRYAYLVMLIYEVITCISMFPSMLYSTILFPILWTMLESETKNSIKKLGR